MAILIANIGTSDLAIKIDDYYFSVGFDRNEPNISEFDLTDDEKALWEQDLRQSFIDNELCPELGMEVGKSRFLFRELTYKMLKAYEEDEETWHERIRPGRIWGVAKAAQEPTFKVREAYIFVTDQPEKESDGTPSKGYLSDSIHLFDILEKWFKREIPNLTLKKKVIPQNISAVDQDKLLNYYYQFFSEISGSETILISTKGGTPQMQMALKLQAIASGIVKQLFIDPKLEIKKILSGKPSECQLTSYWRYMRTQKYQALNLLLDRWDFDGAKQILSSWEKVLDFLISKKVTDALIVTQSNQTLSQVIDALKLGINYINLDYESAKLLLDKNPQLKSSLGFDRLVQTQGDEQLLNLYTQCRIYWKTDQIANFLARMSSFYEETLYRLVIILGGQRYIQGDWVLNTALVRQELGESLWQSFNKAMGNYNYNINVNGNLKLNNRLIKRNFIEKLLLPYRKVPSGQWDVVFESLKQLDFWFIQRNKMIHSAEGVSKERMEKLFFNKKKEDISCAPGQIRDVMAQICSSELGIVREEYREKFVGRNADFYLYSNITNWVLNQLKEESSK